MRDDVRRTPQAIEEEKADASFQAFQRIFAGVWHTLVILGFVISCSKLTGTVWRTVWCGGIMSEGINGALLLWAREESQDWAAHLLNSNKHISIAMCVIGGVHVFMCVQQGYRAGCWSHPLLFCAQNRVHYDSSVFKENHFSSECGHFPSSCFHHQQFVANRCFYEALPTSLAKPLQSIHNTHIHTTQTHKLTHTNTHTSRQHIRRPTF